MTWGVFESVDDAWIYEDVLMSTAPLLASGHRLARRVVSILGPELPAGVER
jgi:hypothetical protein